MKRTAARGRGLLPRRLVRNALQASIVLLLLGPAWPSLAAHAADSIWAHDNLAAWMVTPPSDAKGRGPEERARMLARLGIKNYVFRAEDQKPEIYDAELDALNRHGIKLLAWRMDYEPDDPNATLILQTLARHHLHPQIWVTCSFNDLRIAKMPAGTSAADEHQFLMQAMREDLDVLPQAERVNREAARINAFAKLASPYGVKVQLYNHNGWFGMTDNQLAMIERLKQLGVNDVGIVYNFSHARDELHDDPAEFAAIWKRIKPYVTVVNITGMGTDQQFVYPSQGDAELEMMRTIQQSGWVGPVGLIGEQGGDAEVTLKNELVGLDWLAAELKKPGSGGGHPFPDVGDMHWAKTVVEPVVVRAKDPRPIEYSWGTLTWYVSRASKSSDTMTVGEVRIKAGQSTPTHFHPNCDEVLHVLRGRIRQTLGKKSVELAEGDTLSVPIGVTHGSTNIGSEEAVLSLSYSSADRRVINE